MEEEHRAESVICAGGGVWLGDSDLQPVLLLWPFANAFACCKVAWMSSLTRLVVIILILGFDAIVKNRSPEASHAALVHGAGKIVRGKGRADSPWQTRLLRAKTKDVWDSVLPHL